MVRWGTCVARDERKVTLRSKLWGRGGDSRRVSASGKQCAVFLMHLGTEEDFMDFN